VIISPACFPSRRPVLLVRPHLLFFLVLRPFSLSEVQCELPRYFTSSLCLLNFRLKSSAPPLCSIVPGFTWLAMVLIPCVFFSSLWSYSPPPPPPLSLLEDRFLRGIDSPSRGMFPDCPAWLFPIPIMLCAPSVRVCIFLPFARHAPSQFFFSNSFFLIRRLCFFSSACRIRIHFSLLAPDLFPLSPGNAPVTPLPLSYLPSTLCPYSFRRRRPLFSYPPLFPVLTFRVDCSSTPYSLRFSVHFFRFLPPFSPLLLASYPFSTSTVATWFFLPLKPPVVDCLPPAKSFFFLFFSCSP